MNWLIIIWTLAASTSLTMAVMYLMVWCNKRKAWSNLLFALSAMATVGLAVFELLVMQSETVEEYGRILRWAHVPSWILLLSLVGFVRLYMRAGRVWLAWVICGLRTLGLILNFVFTPNINYREISTLHHVQLLGETVSVAVGTPNPWMLIGQTSLLLFLIFLVDVSFSLWRRRERLSMQLLSISMAFFITIGLGQFVIVFWGIRPAPLFFSIYFLGLVAVMAWQMSWETIRASQLSDDLKKKDAWLALAADSAGVGLWLWDLATNQIWATERARIIYGFSPEEPISYEKFLSRLHPDDRDWVVEATQNCPREGTDFHYDYRIVLPDGNIRLINVLAKTILTPAGAPERMTGISIDITDRKLMEVQLQQKLAELAHVNRLFTMGQLTSTLAHELNQPLGAILRNAEAAELFLQEPLPDFDELRAIMVDIRRDNQRAGKVIDRMRAMIIKPQAAKKTCFDLGQLTDEVITLVQPDANKRHVRLDVQIAPDIPPVHGDRIQLQQVIINLLLNAFEALDQCPPENRGVTISARQIGAKVEIAVHDNGNGIAEETIEHLFDPFYTTKPNGLGMGLAISRSIIEGHGGKLHAANHRTGGATFTLALPAAV